MNDLRAPARAGVNPLRSELPRARNSRQTDSQKRKRVELDECNPTSPALPDAQEIGRENGREDVLDS